MVEAIIIILYIRRKDEWGSFFSYAQIMPQFSKYIVDSKVNFLNVVVMKESM